MVEIMLNVNQIKYKSNIRTTKDTFSGLPNMHKIFHPFPPLRLAVSGLNSCTCNLSKFVDSFWKFQARKCKSYIRDNKVFLIKLLSIKNIPENSFLVTIDVSSLYTNIDHEEGAEACLKKLEARKKEINSIYRHQKFNSHDP